MTALLTAKPVLLFDIMDTVVHDPFYEEVLAFFDSTLDELFADKSKDPWIRFECGELSEEAFAPLYFESGRKLDLEGLKSCMRDAYRWVPGMQEYIAELHAAGYEMHAFSNYPVWYKLIEEKLGLSQYIQWTSVSCETGLRKPALEAYAKAAELAGSEATSCIFIDDRKKNCRAAIHAGMRSVQFRDTTTLKTDLDRLM